MGTIASAVDHSKPSQCCPRNKSPYSLPSWPALLLLLAPRPESSCRGPILLCSRFWIQRRLEACKIQWKAWLETSPTHSQIHQDQAFLSLGLSWTRLGVDSSGQVLTSFSTKQLLFSPSLGKRARSIAAGVYCSKSHEGVELLGVGIALYDDVKRKHLKALFNEIDYVMYAC